MEKGTLTAGVPGSLGERFKPRIGVVRLRLKIRAQDFRRDDRVLAAAQRASERPFPLRLALVDGEGALMPLGTFGQHDFDAAAERQYRCQPHERSLPPPGGAHNVAKGQWSHSAGHDRLQTIEN